MSTLTFISKFKKNTGLVLSADDIRNNYLFGVNLTQSSSTFSNANIEHYIRAAQTEIENFLAIKLQRQLYKETLSFSFDDWTQWGYIRTTYPIVCPISLVGFLNKVKQVEYPQEWLVAKTESSDLIHHRNLYLVPVGNATTHTQAVLFSGTIPQLGFVGSRSIPLYWNVAYSTGFDKVPADILNAIGWLAAINVLMIAGNVIFGRPGINSQSIGIDGLSQSVSSSSAYINQIKAIQADLPRQLGLLKDNYRGFAFTSM